jgi:glycosyltransferase involved in cell wall biosynthesis
MRQDMAGTPCLFTGYLEGEGLAAVFASCDLFVFPSTTDTFGNVVLEAQASGIPVIVSDSGGPHENVVPGETGFVTRSYFKTSHFVTLSASEGSRYLKTLDSSLRSE